MPDNIITRQGRINIEVFNQFIATHDLLPLEEGFKKELKQELALKMVGSSFWTPQFAIKEMLENQSAQKKFTIVTLSFDEMLKKAKETPLTEAEIRAFYDEQNRKTKRYHIPLKRSGDRWVFEQSDFDIPIKEKEIETYYNKIKRTKYIDQPTQIKIRQIIFDKVKEKGLNELKKEAEEVHKQLLEEPKQFAKIADKYSSAATKNGGLVDFFKRGDKDKALEREAFRLKADGDISPVTAIKDGFVIVQRVARKEATFKPLAKVKGEVTKALKTKKFNTEFIKMANRVVRSQADDKKEKFDAFVKRHKGKEERVAAVARNEGPVAGRLFSLKKMGDQMAYLSEGKGVILQLRHILKASVPPYDMMKPFIEKDLYTEKAHKLMTKELKELKAKALKDNKLVAPAGAQAETTDWMDSKSTDKLQALLAKGIPQDLMFLDKKGGVVTASNDKKGFVIRLDELKAREKETADEKLKLKNAVEERFNTFSTISFIASLNRTATIESNIPTARRNNTL